MKWLQIFNEHFYRVFLPIFGNKDVIYTVQGADWYAFFASDTKHWVFAKKDDLGSY